MTEDAAGTGIDITVPHSARIWNYRLGGKDHYAVDRVAGDQFSSIYPGIVAVGRKH